MTRMADMTGVVVLNLNLGCVVLAVKSRLVFPTQRRTEDTDDRQDRSARKRETEKRPEEGDRELHGLTVPEIHVPAYSNTYGFRVGSRGHPFYTVLPGSAVPPAMTKTAGSAA